MSDLSFSEKGKLERRLDMSGGYVWDFTNQTLQDFFADTIGINIYDRKYDRGSGSKANRLRAFWSVEPNHVVGKLLSELLDHCGEPPLGHDRQLHEECVRIAERLSEGAPVFDAAAISASIPDKNFELLARAVKASIDANEPEAGLDRLHTFTTKYLRAVCSRHCIQVAKDKPLHSLLGEYVKTLKQAGHVETEMTERILKATISVLDAFNQVRNDRSLAHDNAMLGYEESLLSFNNVASSIRFIEPIERKIPQAVAQSASKFDDNIPF